ncbi:DUF485 domain-containing protein [Pseudarthrobacter sp. J75]|uniref:DUF485 domain-containing protein n=1 Tax=unclassified Pseudarthrobacter TaxID=2647000 RepID=UPI002E8243AE|nr:MULTISPECIES: DUF485 domain-containing protein [unclassified Pseudarthrobacter]MEE2521768.1 DUF485 domain-containing protein [Pseudarthrobacter sp. J47]MEE2527845.1 DUF485 domain-containing protein [Pseudarthrobacter sp. J75]MEE2569413.1 DUF485 domain-containing protein [Pseudarthrobacter sp. J64]
MTRVRVVAPQSAARTTPDLPDGAEQTDVGQLFVRSLIRSQLRLAMVVAIGFLVILGAFPALLAFVPGLAQTTVGGIPFDWLLLGLGLYPVIALSAWLFVRAANRNESRYRHLADKR